ncbi:hypothetical protein Anapl_15273 [Anas platyrhynchos]|uniref:Uncharacterized protein n=1 Tax=Anas platyrhynchos TaxID=8839 RepID=R0LLH9_ANAPL|nr:hypothetical protein Anapl_15273 [Anas platyrhynchos]
MERTVPAAKPASGQHEASLRQAKEDVDNSSGRFVGASKFCDAPAASELEGSEYYPKFTLVIHTGAKLRTEGHDRPAAEEAGYYYNQTYQCLFYKTEVKSHLTLSVTLFSGQINNVSYLSKLLFPITPHSASSFELLISSCEVPPAQKQRRSRIKFITRQFTRLGERMHRSFVSQKQHGKCQGLHQPDPEEPGSSWPEGEEILTVICTSCLLLDPDTRGGTRVQAARPSGQGPTSPLTAPPCLATPSPFWRTSTQEEAMLFVMQVKPGVMHRIEAAQDVFWKNLSPCCCLMQQDPGQLQEHHYLKHVHRVYNVVFQSLLENLVVWNYSPDHFTNTYAKRDSRCVGKCAFRSFSFYSPPAMVGRTESSVYFCTCVESTVLHLFTCELVGLAASPFLQVKPLHSYVIKVCQVQAPTSSARSFCRSPAAPHRSPTFSIALEGCGYAVQTKHLSPFHPNHHHCSQDCEESTQIEPNLVSNPYICPPVSSWHISTMTKTTEHIHVPDSRCGWLRQRTTSAVKTQLSFRFSSSSAPAIMERPYFGCKEPLRSQAAPPTSVAWNRTCAIGTAPCLPLPGQQTPKRPPLEIINSPGTAMSTAVVVLPLVNALIALIASELHPVQFSGAFKDDSPGARSASNLISKQQRHLQGVGEPPPSSKPNVTLTKFSCKWELELNKRDLEQITDVEGMVIISKNSKYGFVLAIHIYKPQMPYAVSFQFCDLKQDVFTGSTNHK